MMRRAQSQGKPFIFSDKALEKAKKILTRYPDGKHESALLPLLDLAQRDNGGWISQEVMEYVANLLGMPPMQVYEVATFYTMFNMAPVGKYLVQVCTTTPCQLCGAEDILKACNDTAGVPQGETSKDGLFTVMEVECLGACVNAPMVQINDDYYEDLDAASIKRVLKDLKEHKQPTPGSQKGRQASAPEGYDDQAQKAQ